MCTTPSGGFELAVWDGSLKGQEVRWSEKCGQEVLIWWLGGFVGKTQWSGGFEKLSFTLSVGSDQINAY